MRGTYAPSLGAHVPPPSPHPRQPEAHRPVPLLERLRQREKQRDRSVAKCWLSVLLTHYKGNERDQVDDGPEESGEAALLRFAGRWLFLLDQGFFYE